MRVVWGNDLCGRSVWRESGWVICQHGGFQHVAQGLNGDVPRRHSPSNAGNKNKNDNQGISHPVITVRKTYCVRTFSCIVPVIFRVVTCGQTVGQSTGASSQL